MTYFPQETGQTHYDYFSALQDRVQRRRKDYSRTFSLNDIVHLCTRWYRSLRSSLGAITFPPRYLLHVLLVALVVVTSSMSFLSARWVLSPATSPHTPVPFLQGLVAPVMPRPEQAQYTGEMPVAGSAFDQVDSLSIPLDHPRLYAPFTATAHSIMDAAGLRSGPGSDYDSVGTLASATPVQVVGRYTDWFLIRNSDGTTAWIAAELLDLNPTAVELLPQVQDIPAPPPPVIGIVTTPQLALRDGPGMAYLGMTTLSAGVSVDLLARYEGWYQVQTSAGGTGWVSADYLQIEPSVAERVPLVDDIPDAHPALVGMIAAQTVNLRGGPGTAYNRVGSLNAGASLELLGFYQDWFQVRTSTGATGWVSAELVQVSAYIARRVPQANDIPDIPQPPVQQQPARLPQALPPAPEPPQPAEPFQPPSEPPQPLPQPAEPFLPPSEPPQPLPQPEVPVEPVEPVAPVEPEPVAPVEPVEPVAPVEPPVEPPVPPVEPPVEPAPVPAAPSSGVVDFALQFVGASYSWGGASPSGFDCSGFTMYVYQNFGIYLPHSAAAQYNTQYGAIISSQAELAPGDLVFFANTYAAGISHVGIYIGGGNVVQALSPGRGVGIANLNESYWAEHYYSALRPYL